MAEEADPSSKTEAPSQRRLDDARRQGNVAKSADVPAFAVLAAGALVIIYGGSWMAQQVSAGLLPFIDHPADFDLSAGGAVDVARMAARAAMPAGLVLAAAAVAAVVGNLVQHGFLFVPSKLAPDPSKLNPIEAFKRMFGLDGLVNFFKNVAKITVLAAIAWWVITPKTQSLEVMSSLAPAAILPVSAELLRSLVFAVLVFLGVLAGADWFWQRQRFMARMRMSREELKEEHKDSEGDPHLKARLKQIRFMRAKKRMIQNVPKATVVVTNPTHYAVALRYVSGETPAPLCVAKGVDEVALRIREAAQTHKVPVIEDPPLARALYAAIDVDETIPREHYEAVAKIIGFVMGAAKGRGSKMRSRLREAGL